MCEVMGWKLRGGKLAHRRHLDLEPERVVNLGDIPEPLRKVGSKFNSPRDAIHINGHDVEEGHGELRAYEYLQANLAVKLIAFL
jgi:hypothetical protein